MSATALSPELARFAAGVSQHRLANGLTVLLVPRPGVATVHFAMAFGVGWADEDAGRSGVAHLYEHMAFKGTALVGTTNWNKERVLLEQLDELEAAMVAENARGPQADTAKVKVLKQKFDRLENAAEKLIIPNEFDEVYARNGAKGLNAYTSNDATVYIIAMPANRAKLWAAMESARVTAPVLRQFWRERSVVLEEQRRYDDMPNWRLYEALAALAFPAHPYRTPIIGWKSELEKLTRRDLEGFFRSRYRPDRAAICAVGAIHEREMLAMLKSAFGAWQPTLPPPPPMTTVEPDQRGPRRATQYMQANPLLAIGWPIPTWGHPDKAAVDVLAAVLGRGESSRLNASLVKRQRIALYAGTLTEYPGDRFPNLLGVIAAPQAPHTPEAVEAAVHAEVNRLLTDGMKPAELEAAVNLLEADRFKQLQDHTNLAATLSSSQATMGDWRTPLRWVTALRALTTEDIMKAAKTYLVAAKTNTVIVRPPESGPTASAAIPRDNPATWEPPHPDG